jgi:antitoxin (DNA-binding transcriptional repressor) of toxin-antitoxin stability system
MTHKVDLVEAASQLPGLVCEAQRGVEVVLLQHDRPVARLVATETTASRPKRQFGSAKGQVQMSPDFDEPLDDFAEYM